MLILLKLVTNVLPYIYIANLGSVYLKSLAHSLIRNYPAYDSAYLNMDVYVPHVYIPKWQLGLQAESCQRYKQQTGKVTGTVNLANSWNDHPWNLPMCLKGFTLAVDIYKKSLVEYGVCHLCMRVCVRMYA